MVGKFSYLNQTIFPHSVSIGTSVLWWAGWATVTYGRVGKLKTRVGKRKKKIFGEKCLPTLAWNPAGAPASDTGTPVQCWFTNSQISSRSAWPGQPVPCTVSPSQSKHICHITISDRPTCNLTLTVNLAHRTVSTGSVLNCWSVSAGKYWFGPIQFLVIMCSVITCCNDSTQSLPTHSRSTTLLCRPRLLYSF